jgi:hypothetical protein
MKVAGGWVDAVAMAMAMTTERNGADDERAGTRLMLLCMNAAVEDMR